jgi:hypothetical protein
MKILDQIWKFRIIIGNSGSDMEITDRMEITLLIGKFRLLPESYPDETRKFQETKFYVFFF